MSTRIGSNGLTRPAIALGVGLALAVGAGCDSLLDVDAPSRVPADFLLDPANAELLVTSAVADFECAFAEYIVATGLIGNELVDGQLAARMWSYDRRSIDPSGAVYSTFTCADADPGVYQTLSTARFAADNALSVVEDPALAATAAAYAGYSYLLLGEGMCSAAVDGGPELTSPELFALAEARFTTALAGGATPDIEGMSRIGRARARLNQGDGPGASSDAATIAEGFVKEAEYSSASFRSSNRIWTMNNRDERIAVEDDFWQVMHAGQPDPRVPTVDQGKAAGGDNSTPLWTQSKYPNQDSSVPIARWAEAQLIIAEVAGGQVAVDIINRLHSDAGLPPFAGVTEADIQAHVLQERSSELWLESHHLFDKIRSGAEFLPAAGTQFQEGSAAKGGFYGNTTCLPLPRVERENNPNIGD
jgi:hypothetical protein